MVLTWSELSCVSSVFAAAYPPLSDRRDVCECLEKMMALSEQMGYFADREWVDREFPVSMRDWG